MASKPTVDEENLAIALYVENEYGQRKDFAEGIRDWRKEPAPRKGVYLKQAKRVMWILRNAVTPANQDWKRVAEALMLALEGREQLAVIRKRFGLDATEKRSTDPT